MLEYYFSDLFLIHFLELLAAVTGLYFLRNSRTEKGDKLFVAFLWYIFFIESICLYSAYAYFNNYEIFTFLKDSPFKRNYWLTNIHKIISYLVYYYFFSLQFSSKKLKRVFNILFLIYVVTAVINLIVSDVYFYASSSYNTISGTILIMLVIVAYYYQLLLSDKILDSFRSLAFYVSFISLIWYLTTTPLFIYSNYYNMDKSKVFVEVYGTILRSLNVFMYGGYTIAFLILFRKRKLKEGFST